MMPRSRQRFILQVVAGYVVLALAWIFLSDQLLAAFADVGAMIWLSSAKGLFFVAVSAAGFYLALRAVPAAADATPQRLFETLAASLVPGRVPRWAAALFALVVTLTMLAIALRLGSGPEARPLFVPLMLPIVLSALLGGLWPGLLSTALAGAGLAWLAVFPPGSARVAARDDVLQWGLLIVIGAAVSLLSEVLRRAHARAEFNRRLLDAVVSGTSDAVFVKDAQGRYLLANAAAAAFVGREVADMLGRDDRALFAADSAERVVVADRAVLAGGRARTSEEQVTTLDGRRLVFLVTKGPVADEGGKAVGLFGIAHEITARKHAEEEIGRLNAELARRVDERSMQLQSARHELEDLAYALTHNLRAPLRAIGGFSRLLAEEVGSTLSRDAAHCLDQIGVATERLGGMLEGILALLRCSRGDLRCAPVDVSELAARRLAGLARAEPERRVDSEVVPGLRVEGDPALLELVVGHLVDNAWKFTRGKAPARIRVLPLEQPGGAGFRIADNGVGFDMAHGGRLFQPFQRLHREDEFPGIGIGLAAVQRIVHRHGGEVVAFGVPGEGATFSIVLPPVAAVEERDGEKGDIAGRGQSAGRAAHPAGVAEDQPRQ